MLQRIDQVLGRLEGASLTCNAKKCILFATETPYLGHVVGLQGLKMDPEKIRKVTPHPRYAFARHTLDFARRA